MLTITALTASLLAAQLVRLSIGVVALRRKGQVSIGSADDERLERAIRIQSNFTEYTPIALILLGCAEFNGAPVWLLIPLALAFIAGRVLHPMGMASREAPIRPRVLGMHLTFWPILALAAVNVLWILWLLIT